MGFDGFLRLYSTRMHTLSSTPFKVEPLDDNLRKTIELYDTSNLGQLIERLKQAGLKEELDLFDQVKGFQTIAQQKFVLKIFKHF